jgi:hypothetical protein
LNATFVKHGLCNAVNAFKRGLDGSNLVVFGEICGGDKGVEFVEIGGIFVGVGEAGFKVEVVGD